jgi:hypothetical protein
MLQPFLELKKPHGPGVVGPPLAEVLLWSRAFDASDWCCVEAAVLVCVVVMAS